MLARPEEVPNNTMTRWIESILQYTLELIHILKERLTVADGRFRHGRLVGDGLDGDTDFRALKRDTDSSPRTLGVKERRTSFLEPVRASSNVRLIELRPEMQTSLNSQRQTRYWGVGRCYRRCELYTEKTPCWVWLPIKSWNSFSDLYSPRRC